MTAVVDSGLERRVRFDPSTGMDHWETARISESSADQRKGRAGRTSSGICMRLWDQNERLEKHAPAQIAMADLSPVLLECSLWGVKNPDELVWIIPDAGCCA